MPGFYIADRGLLLTLSHCELMRKERRKCRACLSPPAPSLRVFMSAPEQSITFQCRSNTSLWIIFFSNLRFKCVGVGVPSTCSPFLSLHLQEKKKRKKMPHWSKTNLSKKFSFSNVVGTLCCREFVNGLK